MNWFSLRQSDYWKYYLGRKLLCVGVSWCCNFYPFYPFIEIRDNYSLDVHYDCWLFFHVNFCIWNETFVISQGNFIVAKNDWFTFNQIHQFAKIKMQKREVAAGGLIILSASGACFNQLRRMKIILIQFEFCDETNIFTINLIFQLSTKCSVTNIMDRSFNCFKMLN